MRRLLSFAKRNVKLIAALGIGVVIGSAGLAFAAVPDAAGVIHACYRSSGGLANGTLRVIDSENGDTCNTGETAISWNQTGPQGPVGATGPQGPQGPTGPAGTGGVGTFVSDLTNADFRTVDLRYRNMSGVDMHGSLFGSNNLLNHADFQGVNLSGSFFSNGASSFVNFASADFSNATFKGSSSLSFSNSNFSGANFTGAYLQIHLRDSAMSGTNFTNAQFVNASLTGSDLSTANLTGVTWTNTVCPDATNSDANGGTCVGHLVP